MADDSVQATATTIAETLNEPNVALLKRIVGHLGVARARALLEETQAIEAKGGMLIRSGKRRRTPGGVFIHLARAAIEPNVREEIFARPGWRHVWVGKNKEGAVVVKATELGPHPDPKPLETWGEVQELVQALLAEKEHGEASRMDIKLTGRPGKVSVRETFVVTTVQSSGEFDEFPRALPEPPPVRLLYLVYIPRKIWDKIAQHLKDNPKSEMVVQGYLTYDNNLKKLSVFAHQAQIKGAVPEKYKRKKKKKKKVEQPAQEQSSNENTAQLEKKKEQQPESDNTTEVPATA